MAYICRSLSASESQTIFCSLVFVQPRLSAIDYGKQKVCAPLHVPREHAFSRLYPPPVHNTHEVLYEGDICLPCTIVCVACNRFCPALIS